MFEMRTGAVVMAVLGLHLAALSPGVVCAAEPALSGNFLPALLSTSEPHRAALEALIRGRPGLPSWMRNMIRQPRYVALASEKVEIGGTAMQLLKACEPGDCEASRLSVLYSADGRRVVLRLADAKLGEKVLGDPTPGELEALAR